MTKLGNFSSEELLDLTNIARILGYSGDVKTLDIAVMSKGYRMLFKIPRLPGVVVENIVEYFKDFQKIIKSSIEGLYRVEGVGEVRARNIKESLRRIKDQILLDRHLIKK